MPGNYVKLLYLQVRDLGKRDVEARLGLFGPANLTPIPTPRQEVLGQALRDAPALAGV
jgi:hypothetical protein